MTSLAIIDKTFKNHGYVFGRATGDVLPACIDTGLPMEVVDLKLNVKAYKSYTSEDEIELTDELEELVEQYAIDQLCGDK